MYDFWTKMLPKDKFHQTIFFWSYISFLTSFFTHLKKNQCHRINAPNFRVFFLCFAPYLRQNSKDWSRWDLCITSRQAWLPWPIPLSRRGFVIFCWRSSCCICGNCWRLLIPVKCQISYAFYCHCMSHSDLALYLEAIAHCIIVDRPFKLNDFENQNLWDQLH